MPTVPYHAGMASESKRHRIERMHDEYRILCEEFPPRRARCISQTLELLTATILSAQTTDKRVNTVTPRCSRATWTGRTCRRTVEDVEDIIGCWAYHANPAISSRWRMTCTNGSVTPSAHMDELTSCPVSGGNRECGARQRVRRAGLPVDTHVIA